MEQAVVVLAVIQPSRMTSLTKEDTAIRQGFCVEISLSLDKSGTFKPGLGLLKKRNLLGWECVARKLNVNEVLRKM